MAHSTAVEFLRSKENLVILGLQTDTFGTYGGIPTYNRLVCRVLDEIGSGFRCPVLVAMDKQESVARAAPLHPNLQLRGFSKNRIRFALAALRVALCERIDLTVAGHPNYAPLCVLLKLLQPQMRFAVIVYGWDVWVRLSPVRRWSMRRADVIISISDYTKRQAIAVNGLDERRIFVVPNALEWTTGEIIQTTATLELPPGTKLLSVGRLESSEQQKGFDTVIRCLSSIAASVADVQYIIIGSGTDLDRHKQLARELGVAERVHFLGSVDEETLRHCYQTCDLFVMPSAQEGFGFVYLEAMQYSKAVVAASSGGVPEVVEDQLTGRLVEYGNEVELAQVLTELCLDPEKRRSLGAAGYRRLQEMFTFAQFKRNLTEILIGQLPASRTPATEFPIREDTPGSRSEPRDAVGS